MLVSVIVPVYNVKSFLPQALDSVINQSYSDLEIIIVDDGSTDGSSEICIEYAQRDSRIRLIQQDNQGLSAARNAGLDTMNGEIVAFLDSDDAYNPIFIEKLLSVMIQEEADIVLCKRTIHYTTGLLKPKTYGNVDPAMVSGTYDRTTALRAFADGSLNAGVWNKLYRRKLWDTVRFPCGHVYEDTDTTYKILDICKKISVIDQPLYMYRKHSDSITGIVSQNNIRDWIASREHFIWYIKDHTPEIFCEDHLNNVQRAQFRGMISLYGRYTESGNSDPCFAKELRRQIVKVGETLDSDREGFRIKAFFFLICYFPWVLRLIYHAWYSMQQAVLAVVSR